VIAALWEELGVAKTLRRAARRGRFTTDVERAVLVMVCQRMLEPGSKLQATRWLADEVRLPGIVEVTDDQLYRALDFLLEQAEAVQEAVFFSVANLLNLEVDLVFFDTTSTYFEVEAEQDDEVEPGGEVDAGLRRLGHSKDHRPDSAAGRDRPCRHEDRHPRALLGVAGQHERPDGSSIRSATICAAGSSTAASWSATRGSRAATTSPTSPAARATT
jgi:hypothetical protein